MQSQCDPKSQKKSLRGDFPQPRALEGNSSTSALGRVRKKIHGLGCPAPLSSSGLVPPCPLQPCWHLHQAHPG